MKLIFPILFAPTPPTQRPFQHLWVHPRPPPPTTLSLFRAQLYTTVAATETGAFVLLLHVFRDTRPWRSADERRFPEEALPRRWQGATRARVVADAGPRLRFPGLSPTLQRWRHRDDARACGGGGGGGAGGGADGGGGNE